jgi:undecaprenyl-diphosphatase
MDDGAEDAVSRWFALAAAVFLGLAVVLSVAAASHDPLPGDLPVIVWIQTPEAPLLDSAALALSWLGRFLPMVALAATVAAILWRRGAVADARLLPLAALVSPVNWLLKLVVGRVRPANDMVGVLEQASGLGFPSGHAFGAALLFGTLAAIAGYRIEHRRSRTAAVVTSVILALLIGWSRVRLGTHWPSDVLGGWVWGSAASLSLVAFSRGHRLNPKRFRLAGEPKAGPGTMEA